MILLNMAVIFPDTRDASLPSTISCHVNLIRSHPELLTSKQDDQSIRKYSVLPENPPEVLSVDIPAG